MRAVQEAQGMPSVWTEGNADLFPVRNGDAEVTAHGRERVRQTS